MTLPRPPTKPDLDDWDNPEPRLPKEPFFQPWLSATLAWSIGLGLVVAFTPDLPNGMGLALAYVIGAAIGSYFGRR